MLSGGEHASIARFRNCMNPDAVPDPDSEVPEPAHAPSGGWNPIGTNTPCDRSNVSFVTHRSHASTGPQLNVYPGTLDPSCWVLTLPVATGTLPDPFPFLSEIPRSQSPGHKKPQVEYRLPREHCDWDVAPCWHSFTPTGALGAKFLQVTVTYWPSPHGSLISPCGVMVTLGPGAPATAGAW